MICKYFADDGTEFNDYDECATYERRQKAISAVQLSRFWDGNCKPMTLDELIKEPEMCDYMEVANDAEASLIKEFFRDEACLTAPWAYRETPLPGRYYHSRDMDEWRCFDTDLSALREIEKIFEG
jgi:hypothetical protein